VSEHPPRDQLTLDDIRAELPPGALIEVDLAIERATNRKLRAALAEAINAQQQPPASADEPGPAA
jgi:hypothetical protein